jgi:DNA polymerase-3 subunit alpha
VVEAQADDKLAIRYALAALKNIGAAAMAALVEERTRGGDFTDIFDFAERVDATAINRRQLESLIMAGCFDRMHPVRRALYESIDLIIATAQRASQDRHSSQISLFGGEAAPAHRPSLPVREEWSSFDRLQYECAALGFYLSAHPLEAYAAAFKRLAVVPSSLLMDRLSAQYQPIKLAGIVAGSKIKVSPRGRFAFVQLSDASGSYEVSIFDAELLSGSHALLSEGTALLIQADGKRDENGARLIARKLTRLSEAGLDLGAERVTITLHDLATLPQLQALLKPASGKGARVVLQLQLKEGRVTLELPGAYSVAPETLMAMQSLTELEAVVA